MNTQNPLAPLLAAKGIGPKGSKNLSSEQLDDLSQILRQGEFPLTTAAALKVAFWLTDNSELEQSWFETQQSLWPTELSWVRPMGECPDTPLAQALVQVLDRQELSPQSARDALAEILDGAPEWQGGAFLEALRLRRETQAENLAFWQLLQERAPSLKVDLPLTLDLADPYDGHNRSPALLPAVAVLLASVGIPTIIHASAPMPPKWGINSRAVLEAAGVDVLQDLPSLALRLQEGPGWAYVDQEVHFPALAALRTLRTDMVKRPLLATFEKLLMPLRGHKHLLWTGYTHTAYREMMGKLFAANSMGPDAFVVARGSEGGSRPSLARVALASSGQGSHWQTDSFDPQEFGFEIREEAICKWTVQEHLACAQQALQGQGPWAEALLYWALTIVRGLLPERESELGPLLRKNLAEGQLKIQ